ncbi:MAG: class I SAM-dependent methyltransferase [Bryobacteraceae bacterium]
MAVLEACPVCSGQNLRDIDFRSKQGLGEFPIRECAGCTHRFVTNGPSDEDLQAYYDEFFRADQRQSKPLGATWRDRALARTLVHELPRNARVLDIGANFGETLLAMPRTYTLEGVELSATAAAVAARHRRLCIHRGFFETIAPNLPAGEYDAVIALAVIEHLRSPREFLGQVVRLLRPGGIAVLTTGDYATWNVRRLGAAWPLYHCDGHMHFFSGKSLENACASTGLQVYSRIWSGPNPITYRLPAPLGRPLHCRTTSIALPFLFGRRPWGDLIYIWCRKENSSPVCDT